MSLHKVFVVGNFLTPQECQQLNDWTDLAVQNKWADDGSDASFQNQENTLRKTTRGYESRFEFPDFVRMVSDKITERFGLQALNKSADGKGLGVVCTSTLTGGFIPEHTDPLESNGSVHLLRCNILTRKSESGGELFLSGSPIPMNVGDLVCYSPSFIRHSVSAVSGTQSRVMWLFGYQIPENFSINNP